MLFFFFFQAEDGIRDRSVSRGLGDVYKRQLLTTGVSNPLELELQKVGSHCVSAGNQIQGTSGKTVSVPNR